MVFRKCLASRTLTEDSGDLIALKEAQTNWPGQDVQVLLEPPKASHYELRTREAARIWHVETREHLDLDLLFKSCRRASLRSKKIEGEPSRRETQIRTFNVLFEGMVLNAVGVGG